MRDHQDPDLLDDELDSFIQPGCKVVRSQLPSQLLGSLDVNVKTFRLSTYADLFKGSWRRPSNEQMAVSIKVVRLPDPFRDNRFTTVSVEGLVLKY